MKFISTRGNETVTGAEAIAHGIASDGGLFVPETFPAVTREELDGMLYMSYAERAAVKIQDLLNFHTLLIPLRNYTTKSLQFLKVL